MRLPYRQELVAVSPAHPERDSTLRPRIRIRLKHGNQSVDLFALIDSGADDCLFPVGLAKLLGLKLRPQNVGRYVGIGPGEIVAIFHTITLEVGDWSLPIYAGFLDTPTAPALLGQNGFFSQFEVKFNLRKETIELKPLHTSLSRS